MNHLVVQVSPSELAAALDMKPNILLCSIECLASKEVGMEPLGCFGFSRRLVLQPQE